MLERAEAKRPSFRPLPRDRSQKMRQGSYRRCCVLVPQMKTLPKSLIVLAIVILPTGLVAQVTEFGVGTPCTLPCTSTLDFSVSGTISNASVGIEADSGLQIVFTLNGPGFSTPVVIGPRPAYRYRPGRPPIEVGNNTTRMGIPRLTQSGILTAASKRAQPPKVGAAKPRVLASLQAKSQRRIPRSPSYRRYRSRVPMSGPRDEGAVRPEKGHLKRCQRNTHKLRS